MTGATTQGQRTSRPLTAGPKPSSFDPTNTVPSLNEPESAFISEDRRRRLGQETIAEGEDGEHPPTLIEGDIETLFAGFQKRRASQQSEDGTRDVEKDLEWQELEERSRKLKKEELKVRSLNGNGRVDYSIQEGVCVSPLLRHAGICDVWERLLTVICVGFRHLSSRQHSEPHDLLGRRRRLALHDIAAPSPPPRFQTQRINTPVPCSIPCIINTLDSFLSPEPNLPTPLLPLLLLPPQCSPPPSKSLHR